MFTEKKIIKSKGVCLSMKKMALVLAGILAAGSVYAADVTTTPAAAVVAPAAPVTFTYGGFVGVDMKVGTKEVGNVKTSGLNLFGDADNEIELRVKATGEKFEAQVALNDDNYLKLKFSDALSLTYMIGEDVVKVGDEVDQTVGVIGAAGWDGQSNEGLKLDVKLSDTMAVDVGFAPSFCNIDNNGTDVEATKVAVKGGLTLKLGALESITELALGSFAKDVGDVMKIGFGQRLNYVAGNLEGNFELTYLDVDDASNINLYLKGTMGLGGDLKAYVSLKDEMWDNGTTDGSTMTITPGVETKAFGGVKFVGELPIVSADDDSAVALLGKMTYEF